MKKFKTGEYYIFDANIKKIGKATIHGFVDVNGTMHAVVSYRDNDNVPYIKALPVCELNGRKAIFLLDAVFIFASDPVLPKLVKFQVGKAYKQKTVNGGCVSYTVTAKYTDGGTTYIVVDNRDVLKVGKIEIDGEVVEYANFLVGGLLANKTLKEIEE